MGLKYLFNSEKRAEYNDAKEVYERLKKAIEAGSLPTVEDILSGDGYIATHRPYWESDFKHDPVTLAYNKGNGGDFKAVLEAMGNPNRHYDYTYNSGTREAYTVRKSLLYRALEEGKGDIAFYLAQHPETNVEYGGDSDFSPIAMARKQGFIKVTIALAERIAGLRRAKADETYAALNGEADMYDHEAEELKKLDLQDGRYRLPEPPKQPVNIPG